MRQRLAGWQSDRVVERIWAKDATLWPGESELVDRLGWLQLPARSIEGVASLEEFAKEMREEMVSNVVILGMGGSSLAPEVFARTFGPRRGYPNISVLDSTHPDAVAASTERLDLARTVFVVSSKSGGTVETLSLFHYYYDLVSQRQDDPGRRFVAITDPGSSLVELAAERRFRQTFLAPPDVGGRYSALSVFGLLPAAVLGVDLRRVLASAHAVAAACACDDANPGLELGAILAEAAAAGRDKITFVTSPALASFPDWVEQLVAESLGKDGRGVIPVAGERLGPIERYGSDRLFVAVSLEDEEPHNRLEAFSRLDASDCPVIAVRFSEPHDLGGEFFRWEFATAVAGMAMGVHPFNQPDVQLAKEFTSMAMQGESTAGSAASVKLSDSEAVMEFLGRATEGEYIAIQAFLPFSERISQRLNRLQEVLRDRYGVAVTLGYGPRFLHSTGQLHKGGPTTGHFLQITDPADRSLEVPEKGFGFSELVLAQADGDLAALVARSQSVGRFSLGPDAELGLESLIALLGS
ncbi:MAG: glucose-6-phosphate isomerase [bacterium]|nr:glucose-6-phosphate isomerase [bacterium]